MVAVHLTQLFVIIYNLERYRNHVSHFYFFCTIFVMNKLLLPTRQSSGIQLKISVRIYLVDIFIDHGQIYRLCTKYH